MQTTKEVLVGLLRLIISVVTASFACGALFTGINFLRSYGLPDELITVASAPLVATHGAAGIWQPLAEGISWYNTNNPGYGRFGSGFGIMAAALWSLSASSPYRLPARVVIAVPAGMLLGGRAVMMMTSDVVPVSAGALLGAAVAVAHVFYCARASRFQPLPRLYLSGQVVE